MAVLFPMKILHPPGGSFLNAHKGNMDCCSRRAQINIFASPLKLSFFNKQMETDGCQDKPIENRALFRLFLSSGLSFRLELTRHYLMVAEGCKIKLCHWPDLVNNKRK